MTDTKIHNKQTSVYIQYSILFCIAILGIFGVLIIMHKSFIQYGDGYKQGYFWTLELKHQLENLFAGNGIELWSWSKGMGMDVQLNYFIEPFNIIAALFPSGYVELGYTIAAVLKLYFGGIAFLAFCKEIDIPTYPAIFGSLAYVFASFFITVSLIHSSTLINVYMFPLLVWGAERIYKHKSPALFIISVAYYTMVDFYYAYMAAFAVVMYIIVRYFKYKTSNKLLDYAKTYSGFMLYGLIGLLIASFQLVSDASEVSDATVDSATDSSSALFGSDYFFRLGSRIIGRGSTTDYYVVGLSVIVVILVVLSLKKITKEKSNLIMTLIFSLPLIIPFASSMLNGFAYPTLRWTFILIFFASLAAAQRLGEAFEKKDFIIALITVSAIAIWTIGLSISGIAKLSKIATIYTIVQLLSGAGAVILICFVSRKKLSERLAPLILIGLLLVSLSAQWTYVFKNDNEAFLRNNAINKQLLDSPQRVGNQIDGAGFYRIDQVDAIGYSHVMKSPANESLWWRTNNIYLYNSRIPASLLEFNRLLGNNYGYSKRVYVLSNDNRAGLDYLCGVRYFIGDDNKTGRHGSDEYAGYGFELTGTIDGVNIFENKHYASLGYAYEKILPESELLKLNRLEREQALLQAAVVEDSMLGDKDDSLIINAGDIETGVKEIDYKIKDQKDLELKEDEIIVSEKDASFKIAVADVKNAQLVVSFDGLLRSPDDSGQSKSFIIHAKNEYVDKMADNTITNQSIPYIRDYDLNMGYYENYNGEIEITLSDKGRYQYDSIKVYAMDMSIHEKYVSELEKHALIVDDYDTKKVSANIDAGTGGLIYISMPIHESWDLYIDGEKVDTIDDVNIAFWGAELGAGSHEVELRYVNRILKTGLILSLVGVCLLGFIIYNYQARLRKQNEKDS